MRKQILLFFAMIMSMMATAQVTIQMEKDGGVYKVPCTVNGVKMKFIFDTGAATVSMSQTMAQFLLDGEYLSESDINGTGKSVLADGSIVNHAVVNLRDVEIGGLHIHNIEATVIEGQNAPLLLGQTAISELGRVTIDGNKLVIHSADKTLTRQQVIKLEEQANRYLGAESFVAAIESYVRIDEAIGLSEEHLKNLCYCCFMNHDLERCIQYGLRWIKEYDGSASLVNKIEVYNCLADSYFSGLFDYDNALLWYQKELEIMAHPSMSKYYADTYKILLGGLNNSIADCYCYKGRYNFAITYYKQAVKLQCESMNVKMEKVKRGEVKDEFLAYYIYNYALCLYKQKEDSDGDEVMKLAALCGDQNAIDFCRKYNINYQVKSSKLFE